MSDVWMVVYLLGAFFSFVERYCKANEKHITHVCYEILME